jgi:GNAT superfamily N-acetyltransferase
VAVLNVGLPHWDNTYVGFVHVTVDPLVRRQGIRRRLFEAGVERARAEGRTLVLSDSPTSSTFRVRVVANDVLHAPQGLAFFVSSPLRSKVERAL